MAQQLSAGKITMQDDGGNIAEWTMQTEMWIKLTHSYLVNSVDSGKMEEFENTLLTTRAVEDTKRKSAGKDPISDVEWAEIQKSNLKRVEKAREQAAMGVQYVISTLSVATRQDLKMDPKFKQLCSSSDVVGLIKHVVVSKLSRNTVDALWTSTNACKCSMMAQSGTRPKRAWRFPSSRVWGRTSIRSRRINWCGLMERKSC